MYIVAGKIRYVHVADFICWNLFDMLQAIRTKYSNIHKIIMCQLLVCVINILFVSIR